MADGEIREQRVVLKGGIVMLFGKGFQSPDLVDHAGEVVEVLSSKEGESEVMVKAGGEVVKLNPIHDLTALANDSGSYIGEQCLGSNCSPECFPALSWGDDHGWKIGATFATDEPSHLLLKSDQSQRQELCSNEGK